MPPKFKFQKREIIQVAFDIVRQGGWQGFSARAMAEKLGSSSKPIYGYFKSMAELEEAVVKKTVDLLGEYMVRERTGDPWHDHGIGYALFGLAEKDLFMAANDTNHIAHYRNYGQILWDTLTASLSDYPPFKGLTEEQIYNIQLLRWLLAHGLAFQAASQPPGLFSEENITEIMRQGSEALISGLKTQFGSQTKVR
jgi:AcrR family transcriptional regulator